MKCRQPIAAELSRYTAKASVGESYKFIGRFMKKNLVPP